MKAVRLKDDWITKPRQAIRIEDALANVQIEAQRYGMLGHLKAARVYGPSRVLQLGRQTVQMKHAALRHFVFDGAGALVIQAMRFLGKDSIDDSVIRKLRTTLSTDDKVRLLWRLTGERSRVRRRKCGGPAVDATAMSALLDYGSDEC